MENWATKKSRTDNNLSDVISHSVRECMDAMLRTVEERLRSWTPLLRTNGRENPTSELNPNDTTPTISNVTTQESEPSNDPLIRDFPAELRRIEEKSVLMTNMATETYLESLFEMGYGSDGDFPDFVNEGDEAAMLQYVEEEMTNNLQSPPQQDTESKSNPAEHDKNFILITDEQLGKLKLDEMRQECKKRVLCVGGRKVVLQDQLKKAMIDKVPIVNTEASVAPQPGLFQSGAYWEFLTPKSEPVEDPTEGTSFHMLLRTPMILKKSAMTTT